MAALAASQCMAFNHHDAPAMHHDAPADHDHGSHGHQEQKGEHDGDDKASHCGPCAACCASASLAAPPVQSSGVDAPHARVDSLPVSFTPGLPPDELDRPPLSL
jgi:hypothetical protein